LIMKAKQQTALFIIIAIVSTAAVAVGVTYVVLAPTPGKEANAVEIYHWWTSGGEAAAINALVDEFSSQYPNTTVQQVQIAGGAGFEMRVKIKTLMIAGDPPDTFQVHAGYEWKLFYDAGLLSNIDNIWTDNLKSVIPDVIEDINKGPDGHYYSVPVNIHRSNVVWYNYAVLNNTGIDPSTLTTWDKFFQACDWIEGNGTATHAVNIGPQWTQAHAFEQILASQGIDVYQAWINGEIDSTSATYYSDLLAACGIYNDLLGYTGTPLGSWDDATAEIITGDVAFNIMGDWANGEFYQSNYNYTRDYGTMAVPGTNNMYGLVIDCFEKPKNIDHPTSVDHWLSVVASKDGQDAFNPLKGSIAARTDANLSKYGAYQTAAIQDFNAIDASATSYMYPSVVHGSGAPEAFNTDLAPIIGELTSGSASVSETAQAIATLAQTYSSDFTRTWDLGGS
ncbi:MAG: ABC transporter substrate-binding protein, partial [Candidatus Lokiarchaeota archaeon]